jgi:hypothetical protein
VKRAFSVEENNWSTGSRNQWSTGVLEYWSIGSKPKDL